MRDDIRAAKSPPSLALRMQILNFIVNLNSQSNNHEKNTHVNITRRKRFEKMSRKLSLVVNSEAREWRHDSDKTQTNKLESWMILKISLRAKAGVPKTLLTRKFRLHSLYFPQNTLMLPESRGEFSDLYQSIFRLRALRYSAWNVAIT